MLPTSSTPAGATRRVRFSPFEFDVRTRELHKDGVRLRLHGMPVEVLAALVERPGDLVTRAELRARLWADDTFLDYENSLNSAVARLREALGDTPDRPRYIETLPKRGYRFIATLDTVDGSVVTAEPVATNAASTAEVAVPALVSDAPGAARRWHWVAIALLIVATLGAALWTGSRWFEQRRRLRDSRAAFERGETLLREKNPAAAISQLQEAVRLDPNNARIYGALAHALAQTGTAQSTSVFRQAGQSPSVIAAERGVALDPTCADCHGTYGMFLFYHDWQWTKAEKHLLEAIRLGPDEEGIRPAYAMLLAATGRPREAIKQVDIALEKQPFQATWLGIRASALYYDRRYAEAIATADKILMVDNRNSGAWEWRSKSLFQLDRGAEAIHALAQVLFSPQSADLDRAVQADGVEGGLRKLLALTEDWRGKIEHSWRRAAWRTLLNDAEGALDELATAVQARRLNAPNFAVDPVYDSLRHHPRFHRLLEDVGLAGIVDDAVTSSHRSR